MHSSRLALLQRHLPGVPVRASIAAALALHLLAAWFHPGWMNADEHYQLLEFAWYRLGHSPGTALPWEFPAQIRPALQPLVASGVIRGLELAGAFTPFLAELVLRVMSALLGLWVTVALSARLVPSLTRTLTRRLAFAGSLFFWIAPSVHGRFSAENWGGIWLFAGICLALDALDAWPAARRRALLLAAGAGLAWGVSFYCRFQVGFALAGIGFWLAAVRRAPARLVAAMAAAGFVALAFNVGVDRWFYGAWVLTPVSYFRVNILEGVANTFGTSPAWVVLMPFVVAMGPPFSVVFLAAIAAGCWYARRHVLVWAAVPFVVGHALVAHKEARFMVPMIYALVPLLAVSLDALPASVIGPLERWTGQRWGRLTVAALSAANLVALAVLTVVPINDRAATLEWLWKESQVSPLTLYSKGGAPYDDGLALNFYRAPGVRVVPLATLTDGGPAEKRPGERTFVLYEGTRPPVTLSTWLAGCRPVAPALLGRLLASDGLRRFTDWTFWTLCRPDATSWASAWREDFRRRGSPRPNPD